MGRARRPGRPGALPALLAFGSSCLLPGSRGAAPPAAAPPGWPAADVPAADPAATVRQGRARFTVLSPCLLRLELSQKSVAGSPLFDDRATQSVVNRRLPVPAFGVARRGADTVVVTTDRLRLAFNSSELGPAGGGFTPESLQIELLGAAAGGVRRAQVWRPGTVDAQNLNGTFDRGPSFSGGWDCYSTPEDCAAKYPRLLGQGLLSRSGWALVNDTNATRFAPNEPGRLPWLDGAATRAQNRPLAEDLYFLGPGLDFALGLAAWAAVSGPPALPPMAALGVWFSHYTVFSAGDYLKNVVEGYESRGLPLNMAVLDVPWHYDRYNATMQHMCNNWGGFTPNATLFPDMPAFLDEMHAKGLKVVLSNHMQVGISPCEEHYEDLAFALGKSPEFVKSRETIACALDNRTWVEAFFRVVLDSPTLRSVDYWWNDFPGCATNVTGWDGQAGSTMFWADYVFDLYQRLKGKRSVLLSRYGGLGSQRQGIGFSGDVFQNFSTLAAEVELTPTSSNVLFGWWSHDIGGFHNGTDDKGDNDPKAEGAAELFLRWVQFGTFSPIFRTHGQPEADRYLWEFSTYPLMRELVILRNAMVPHIYTLAWIAHRSAISVVRPMYYAFPEAEEAYRFKGQYMFGPDTLVAPIVSAVTKPNGTAAKDIWLPPSPAPWLSWDGRAAFRGASVRTLCFGLADLPVFVRAGTVMPTRTAASSRAATADPLVWVVWLGGDGAQTEGSGTLYEDAGDGFAHLSAAHLSAAPEAAEPEGSALTRALLRASGAEATVRLLGTRGSYPGQPPSREVVLQLRGGPQGRSAAVRVDGRPVPAGGARGSLVDPPGAFTVSLGRRGIRQDTVVHIAWPASEPPAPLRYV